MAAGNATFSLVMRPEADIRLSTRRSSARRRTADLEVRPAVPENFPPGKGPIPTAGADPDAEPGPRPPRAPARLRTSRVPRGWAPPPCPRPAAVAAGHASRSPRARPWRLSRRAADPARLPGHPARRRGPGGRLRFVPLSAGPRLVPGVDDRLAGRVPRSPDVSMTRVAAGRRRSASRPGRRSGGRRRRRPRRGRAAARAGLAASQVTSQTSSHSVGQAALDELDRLDRRPPAPRAASASAIAARIRGRTAGWTIASRSRKRRRVGEHDPAERRPIERRRRARRTRVAEPAR